MNTGVSMRAMKVAISILRNSRPPSIRKWRYCEQVAQWLEYKLEMKKIYLNGRRKRAARTV
jgi:hypothetical protein